MWRTRVGYAGGTRENPTYHALGDHTEVFQVDYDPEVVSYEDLVALVWQSHDPTRAAFKVQYASLVLAHDDGQMAAARASAERLEWTIGRRLATRIERLDRFWLAEDYHQKYYLRNDGVIMADFREMFGADQEAFRESTAAMLVNAALAADSPAHRVEPHLDELGLSEKGRARLLSRLR